MFQPQTGSFLMTILLKTTSPNILSLCPPLYKYIDFNDHILFFQYFIYLLLERVEGREKERERNINVWFPLTNPTGDLVHISGVCPDWESNQDPLVCWPALNPLSHTSQSSIIIF